MVCLNLFISKLVASYYCNITSQDKGFDGELPSEDSIKDQIKRGEDPYLKHIAEARNRVEVLLKENPNTYTEVHHIIPRYEGGSDDPENLVRLTYNDHAIAHYIRWLMFGKPGDKVAYQVMIGQSIDVRKERARLGGLAGGPIGQQILKERQAGWYNSEGQRKRGIKGAAVNREQGTGGFDPNNLQKANDALVIAKATNPEKYQKQNQDNLKKGRQTQQEKGINLGNKTSQRLKSLKRVGIVLDNKRYSLDTEQRTYVSETALDYYLLYAPLRDAKKD